jgi:hypothetical protein
MIDKTYNNVMDALTCVAYSHGMVYSISTGNIEEIDTSGAVKYPLVHIVPNEVVAGTNTLTFNFNILAMDLVQVDESNEQEVLSDTLSILTDIIAQYRQGGELQIYPDNKGVFAQVDEDITIEPFTEHLDNVVSGWNASFSIEIPYQYKACSSFNITNDGEGFTFGNTTNCLDFSNTP